MSSTSYSELKQKVNTIGEGALPAANIIISGVSGSGKSTLINAIFGEELAKTGIGKPVTDHIEKYEKENAPVRIWDTVGFELKQSVTKNVISDIKQLISDKSQNKQDLFDRIHSIWYCIQSTGTKLQPMELQFIKELHGLGVPFIIVLTKCISRENDDKFAIVINSMLRENGVSDIPIVKVLAQDYEIDEDMVVKHKGLDELVNVTTSKLPDFILQSFIAAQKVEKVIKRKPAEDIVLRYCKYAKEQIIMKIPIINLFAANSQLEKMFKEIGQMYNTYLSDDDIKKIYKNSIGEWSGKMWNLMIPFELPDMSKASQFFKKKVKDQPGFEGGNLNFDYWERSAKLITWAGYSWILSIEEFWDQLVEEKNEKIKEEIIDKMITRLKHYMKEK